MRRLLGLIPIAVVCALVVAVSASAGGSNTAGKSVTVIEHATTDTTTDTGQSGDSAGDVLTFANDVYNAEDKLKAGTDNGYCLRTVAGAAYECTWTVSLESGAIVVNGPFYDTKDSTLAITGGTGSYKGARGTMDLRSRDNGAKYVFAYHVIG